MSLYEKYLNGREEEVWKELLKKDFDFFFHQEEVNKIMERAIKRVKLNIKKIVSTLPEYDYVFYNFYDEAYDLIPYQTPSPHDLQLIRQMEDYLSNSGKLPFSFIKFFEQIKEVELSGFFKFWEDPPLLDYLGIMSVEGIIAVHDLESGFEPDSSDDRPSIIFAFDKNLKENVSGDAGYYIFLTPHTEIDGKILDVCADSEMYFLDYLRFCFYWGGFPELSYYEEESLPEKVQAYLKEIRQHMLTI